jgi:hypothetical protein
LAKRSAVIGPVRCAALSANREPVERCRALGRELQVLDDVDRAHALLEVPNTPAATSPGSRNPGVPLPLSALVPAMAAPGVALRAAARRP